MSCVAQIDFPPPIGSGSQRSRSGCNSRCCPPIYQPFRFTAETDSHHQRGRKTTTDHAGVRQYAAFYHFLDRDGPAQPSCIRNGADEDGTRLRVFDEVRVLNGLVIRDDRCVRTRLNPDTVCPNSALCIT